MINRFFHLLVLVVLTFGSILCQNRLVSKDKICGIWRETRNSQLTIRSNGTLLSGGIDFFGTWRFKDPNIFSLNTNIDGVNHQREFQIRLIGNDKLAFFGKEGEFLYTRVKAVDAKKYYAFQLGSRKKYKVTKIIPLSGVSEGEMTVVTTDTVDRSGKQYLREIATTKLENVLEFEERFFRVDDYGVYTWKNNHEQVLIPLPISEGRRKVGDFGETDLQVLDEFALGVQKFDSVLRIEKKNPKSLYFEWYAKGVGLIKWEYIDSDSKEVGILTLP